MSPALTNAIERLYAVFSDPRPRIIEGCPCCLTSRKPDILLSKPLREITPRDLARYAAGLFLTVGATVDFRYLLPRIFEISATDESWYLGREVVLGKLAFVDFGSWSTAEREAVLNYISALIDTFAQERTPDDDIADDRIDGVLCGVARAGLPLAPHLNRLVGLADSGPLRDLYRHNADALAKGQLSSGYWTDAPEAARDMIAFLTSPAVAARIGTA